MAIRESGYALARSVPYFVQRGALQTLTAPVRYGATGALVSPDSGTVTITGPSGTIVSAAAVTVSDSQATYDWTPAATASLGSDYEVIWTLVFSTVTYPPFRATAYMTDYMLTPAITVLDLYTAMPELRYRIPQAQTTDRGDSTGWQPQIDAAYYELLRKLLADGRSPWLIREIPGAFDWMLVRAQQKCIAAIEHGPDSSWSQKAKELAFEFRRVDGQLRFQFSEDGANYRRSASPVTSLAPAGRPKW